MFLSFDFEWDNKSSLVMARMFYQTPSHCLPSVIHNQSSVVGYSSKFSEDRNLRSQSRPITSRFREPIDIC
jgi:hypothetical protein